MQLFSRMLAACARLAWIGLALALPSLPAAAIEYIYNEPGPTGTVRVSRPTVSWRISPGRGTWISGTQISLNGYPVRAAYSREREAVVYSPSESLRPGTYAVRCRVELNGSKTVERSWKFSVADDADDVTTVANESQTSVLAAANVYRRLAGLSPLRADSHLAAAAMAHSRYLMRNQRGGHVQEAGLPEFSGVNPEDRVSAFGYSGGSYEGVHVGNSTPASAIAALMDAPYHRLPFLQPGSVPFGAGYFPDDADGLQTVSLASQSASPAACTLEFGDSGQEGTVVYPAHGQQNVPLSWNGLESPNPLRMHRARGPVGYVITLFHFSPMQHRLNVREARLTTADGRSVPFFLNTPSNDNELKNGVFLIPKSPLAPRTTYCVSVSASTQRGKNVSRQWSFTTGSGSDAPVTLEALVSAGRR